MTTSNLSIKASAQSKAKRIGAAIALAIVSSLVGLSAITSSAHAFSDWSTPDGLGGWNHYYSDGTTGWSTPDGLGGWNHY